MIGREIWIERRKWPDVPHYGHAGWILGEDDDGLWLQLRAGQPVYRGDEVLFHGTFGGLMLSPPHRRTLVWFPEHGDVDLYVDIVRDVDRTDDSLVMVDMDLDVVRWRADGRVELVDEDELAQHTTTYGYTDAMVEEAIAGGAEVLRAVQANEAPYDGVAAARWAVRATSGGGTTSGG